MKRIIAGFYILSCVHSFAQSLITQSDLQFNAKSFSCLKCHAGIEPMHANLAVKIGCTDCHGGNSQATIRSLAHVQPRLEANKATSANAQRTYALGLDESYEFVRFINPGDLRVAEESCGSGRCHPSELLNVKKSLMATSAMFWGGASYNNGILPFKNYIIGESYAADGSPQRVNTIPPPDAAARAKGVLPYLLPLPRWEITQPPDNFRSFERGGLVQRINPSEIGVPNAVDFSGKPDNKLSDRGLGTQLLISSPVLNLHKTRLNDPHLWFLGTNDQPGDYRSSGCSACHVVYANDRSQVHSGSYAKYGNRGRTFSADSIISGRESGHPIKHQFTSAIPSSQCMTCHMHQANGFMNTFFGLQMWDYETDGEAMYPEKSLNLSDDDKFARLEKNPEEAVLRGNWGESGFLRTVSELNPKLKHTQFADYHGHGWNFRAVFKKDRKGRLLDAAGAVIPDNSAHKFHGVMPLEGQKTAYNALQSTQESGSVNIQSAPDYLNSGQQGKPGIGNLADSGFCDESCRNAQKAVLLQDIHAEKGMHCIDCHFEQDNHGNGKLYGEFHNAVEIDCKDCHGTVNVTAPLKTSGLAAQKGGLDMAALFTPDGRRRFSKRSDGIYQRSMLDEKLEWRISQVAESVDKNSPHFNAKSQRAKLISRNNLTFALPANKSMIAHPDDKMECSTCHNSWVTNCWGCHLPQQANWQKSMNRYEGEQSRNWTSYNPQVIRDDAFMLAINPTTKGNKFAPARSSSAVMLSSRNANREQIYNQQAPISSPGFSSQAFNTHTPHTVRNTETRACADCHISARNDNNAWLAQAYLFGTGMVNFIGKYVYVGQGNDGFSAVKVTEDDEPQAVIGSYLHKLAFPDEYAEHQKGGKKLREKHHHGGTNIQSMELRGEYLYTANGEDGFRVYDVANIDNKGFSERIVSAPVSPFGQDTQVDTKFATAVALPTTMPINTRSERLPENQEQPLHDLYSYAYIADKFEGLILVDVMPLVDRDPRNNFLERAVTFNPRVILTGARNITIAGNYAYICADTGLVVINIDAPKTPNLTKILNKFSRPVAVAIQFRYAFVLDAVGLHVVDVTVPEQAQIVPGNTVKLANAHDVYLARTYAYVAAGARGMVIVDIEIPDSMFVDQQVTFNGRMNDARAITIGAYQASTFAYVADGKNGLKVIQLTSPETKGFLGFSPRPEPKLIAEIKLDGEAIALARCLERDRAVDESGNQVSVFGRLGARPMTLDESRKLYWKDGKTWKVK